MLTNQPSTPKQHYDEHAKLWEKSKLSQKKYCQTHELHYGLFVAAHSRLQALRGKTRPARRKKQFIKLKPTNNNSANNTVVTKTNPISLRFTNGHVLELPTNLKEEQYKVLFKSLQGIL